MKNLNDPWPHFNAATHETTPHDPEFQSLGYAAARVMAKLGADLMNARESARHSGKLVSISAVSTLITQPSSTRGWDPVRQKLGRRVHRPRSDHEAVIEERARTSASKESNMTSSPATNSVEVENV